MIFLPFLVKGPTFFIDLTAKGLFGLSWPKLIITLFYLTGVAIV